ncbi:hypothetical protein JHK86_016563 [Glycine max]|nr:hypothetical protein JHK86_016563 [Glycine max]
MVSDVCVGGDTSFRVNSKMYTKLDSCLVIPPTPNRAKPRAIVKFLGGAFIGAVPEVTYGLVEDAKIVEDFYTSLSASFSLAPSHILQNCKALTLELSLRRLYHTMAIM